MIKFLAIQISLGVITLDNVPERLKEKVTEYLQAHGMI